MNHIYIGYVFRSNSIEIVSWELGQIFLSLKF
jgi:hypothetical protein